MALARIDDKWIFPATSVVLPINLSHPRSFRVDGKLVVSPALHEEPGCPLRRHDHCGAPRSRERLKTPHTEERLVLATGRYLGEGFDDASLDTLFLTMPISWRGTLAQYVGRLHREHHAKREVIVYDYVDSGVPLLARMALKRQTGYRSLGYENSEVAAAMAAARTAI
jgi:hypothetical protein